jgi:hypothetical protein
MKFSMREQEKMMIKFSDCLIDVTAWASLISLIGVIQFRNNFFACIMKRKFKG